jgi:hypothetical protein
MLMLTLMLTDWDNNKLKWMQKTRWRWHCVPIPYFHFHFHYDEEDDWAPAAATAVASHAVTRGRHASSATATSAQALAAVAAARYSGLGWNVVAAASRMPLLTPVFCVDLVHKLNVCYTWHRMQYFQGYFPPELRLNSGFQRIPKQIILALE